MSLNTGRKTGVAVPVDPITGEPKNRAATAAELIDAWPTFEYAHRLTLDQIEHEDGELPVFVARCKCGYESRPASQSIARDLWREHTPDLWEVAS